MIEIRELHVKVNIDSESESSEPPRGHPNSSPSYQRELKHLRMEEYLEQVAMILKNKKER